jgi:hypothetical protein
MGTSRRSASNRSPGDGWNQPVNYEGKYRNTATDRRIFVRYRSQFASQTTQAVMMTRIPPNDVVGSSSKKSRMPTSSAPPTPTCSQYFWSEAVHEVAPGAERV